MIMVDVHEVFFQKPDPKPEPWASAITLGVLWLLVMAVLLAGLWCLAGALHEQPRAKADHRVDLVLWDLVP